jgi:acetyl esterase/lipase
MTHRPMSQVEVNRFFDDLHAWAFARSAPASTTTYGEHPDQVVDLYGAEGRDGTLVLVLHGGFWRAGFTRRNTVALAVALAEAGWASANVEYRRLGPGEYRPLLDDVHRARERIGSFERIVAVGHSAGAQLALWLAAERAVDAAVALGGVCDLGAAAADGLGGNAVVEFLGGSPVEVPDAYREVDPAARVPLGARQVIVHGVDDDRVPVDHARRYVELASAAGDDCRLVEVDGDHFAPIDPRSTAWPAVLAVVASLARDPVEATTS